MNAVTKHMGGFRELQPSEFALVSGGVVSFTDGTAQNHMADVHARVAGLSGGFDAILTGSPGRIGTVTVGDGDGGGSSEGSGGSVHEAEERLGIDEDGDGIDDIDDSIIVIADTTPTVVTYERPAITPNAIGSFGFVELGDGYYDQHTGYFIDPQGLVYADFQTCVNVGADALHDEAREPGALLAGVAILEAFADDLPPPVQLVEEAADGCAGTDHSEEESGG